MDLFEQNALRGSIIAYLERLHLESTQYYNDPFVICNQTLQAGKEIMRFDNKMLYNRFPQEHIPLEWQTHNNNDLMICLFRC